MDRYFLRANQHLWGFKIKTNGEKECETSKVKSHTVRKIADHCLDEGIEMHFMPKEPMPFFMIKRPNSILYYLTSEYDAEYFKKNILVAGTHELCQVV